MTAKQIALRPDPEQLRAAGQANIEVSPEDLVILREVLVHQGGPSRGEWHEQPPGGIRVRCRIALAGGGSSNVSDPLTGHQERDTSWILRLPPILQIGAGEGEDGRSRLELLHPVLGRCRIRRLRPVMNGGVLTGWQADLELPRGPTPVVSPQQRNGGRPRLEDDPHHPWRQQLAQAERLHQRGLSWAETAEQLGLTEERLAEYRRRADF